MSPDVSKTSIPFPSITLGLRSSIHGGFLVGDTPLNSSICMWYKSWLVSVVSVSDSPRAEDPKNFGLP